MGFGGLRFVERGTPPRCEPFTGLRRKRDDGIAGEDAVDEDRSAAAQEKEMYASGSIAREHEMREAAAAGEEVTDKVRQRSYYHHLQASTTVVQPTVGTDCRHARNAGVGVEDSGEVAARADNVVREAAAGGRTAAAVERAAKGKQPARGGKLPKEW